MVSTSPVFSRWTRVGAFDPQYINLGGISLFPPFSGAAFTAVNAFLLLLAASECLLNGYCVRPPQENPFFPDLPHSRLDNMTTSLS